MRLIGEMREAGGKPHFMVWENVANIFSCNDGHDFRTVLAEVIVYKQQRKIRVTNIYSIFVWAQKRGPFSQPSEFIFQLFI